MFVIGCGKAEVRVKEKMQVKTWVKLLFVVSQHKTADEALPVALDVYAEGHSDWHGRTECLLLKCRFLPPPHLHMYKHSEQSKNILHVHKCFERNNMFLTCTSILKKAIFFFMNTSILERKRIYHLHKKYSKLLKFKYYIFKKKR